MCPPIKTSGSGHGRRQISLDVGISTEFKDPDFTLVERTIANATNTMKIPAANHPYSTNVKVNETYKAKSAGRIPKSFPPDPREVRMKASKQSKAPGP